MNVVKISDGLGNQMFQYAFAKMLQIVSKKKVYLDCDLSQTLEIACYSEELDLYMTKVKGINR